MGKDNSKTGSLTISDPISGWSDDNKIAGTEGIVCDANGTYSPSSSEYEVHVKIYPETPEEIDLDDVVNNGEQASTPAPGVWEATPMGADPSTETSKIKNTLAVVRTKIENGDLVDPKLATVTFSGPAIPSCP